MSYVVVKPPFNLRFTEMTPKELRGYAEWFHRVSPERIAGLESEVRSNPEFASWKADASPQSLEGLGAWFAGQVALRSKTPEEAAETRAIAPFPVEVSDRVLTDRTYSLAMDIGMYFGRVLANAVHGSRWEQSLKDKRSDDYGQLVLMGVGPVGLSPVQLVITFAFGLGRGTKTGAHLRHLYEVWLTMLTTGRPPSRTPTLRKE